ncbi:MAG: S53 family peptidase, partial [Phycisphaerales bacterium]
MRFEAMEERALLSVSGQCSYQHVLLEPATYPQPQGESPAESPMLTSSLTPAQIRGAYGIDKIKLGSLVGDGTGQTIAIVDAYDNPSFVSSTSSSFSTSDLAVFDDYFGLPDPPSFLKLNQTGGTSYPTGDTGWGQEIALDVEWAHAVAPGANIILFEANSNSTSDLMAAVNTARNYPGVSVISLSWGSTDYGSGYLYDSYFTTPSGHTGVTFLASSGDDGKPGIYPAYSPNVVAVGGTSLTVSGTNYVSETAWSGSGGGQSSYESEPTYQNAFQSSGKRQMPDVSFDADPNSGVKFYDTYGFSGWGNIGGTSLSAPCWAGLVAIANQLRAEAGLGTLDANGSPTQVHTLLYGFAGSSSSYNTLGYYHDITSGSNGYSAAAGYDLVTGLGSPVANKLVPSLVTVTSKGSVGFSASTYAPSETPLVTILD